MKRVDVYSYGVISASTLHLLSQQFPVPDGYAEIAETHFMTGGEALNSTIVLSRLGLSAQLDGNWISGSTDGQDLLQVIRRHGIDARRIRARKGYSGVREVVFSDNRTRTIFGTYVDLLSGGRKWNVPQKVDIAGARIVCVDPPFRAESALVGAFASELDVPFVSVDCACDNPLATGAASTVISGEFRSREYPGANLSELFERYADRCRGLVVFTDGAGDVLYGRNGTRPGRFAPYRVEVVDSAGAGDSFRAGITYGLLAGWSDEKTISYASAVAAIVCERFPGVLNSPSHDEVVQFAARNDASGVQW